MFHQVIDPVSPSDSNVWSDLHLNAFQRVDMSGPVTPRHAVSERGGFSSLVESVEIALVTTIVPPSTFEFVATGRCLCC